MKEEKKFSARSLVLISKHQQMIPSKCLCLSSARMTKTKRKRWMTWHSIWLTFKINKEEWIIIMKNSSRFLSWMKVKIMSIFLRIEEISVNKKIKGLVRENQREKLTLLMINQTLRNPLKI